MYDENNFYCAPFILLPRAMFNLQMGIIGSEETIRRITPNDMRDLIKKWYLPQNIVISIAGGISFKEAIDAAENFFGRFGSTWNVNVGSTLKNSLPLQNAADYAEKVGRFDQTHAVLGFRSFGYHDQRRFAAGVLSVVLGGGMSSRLFSEVREKRGLAYRTGATVRQYYETGVFVVNVMTTNPKEAFDVILSEIKRIKEIQIEDEELESSKFRMKAYLKKLEDSTEIAGRNAGSVLNYGKVFTREEIYGYVDSVSKEDVLDAANHILNLSEVAVALTSPETLEKDFRSSLRVFSKE